MDGQEPQPIWEQQPGESLMWYKRFTRFRLMEPVRKIALVFQAEEREKAEKAESRGKARKLRTEPPGSWYEAARDFQWEKRAAAWDAHQAKVQERLIEEEKGKILSHGFALMHERVRILDALTRQLLKYTEDEEKIWLPDVKTAGFGESAERVDLVVFNDALFEQIRKYLTDLAAEMGERVKTTRQEVSGSVDITGAKDALFNKLAAFQKSDQEQKTEPEPETPDEQREPDQPH